MASSEPKKLIIMRGLPGSGKSTKSSALSAGGVSLSTDEFWGPNYDFDVTRLGDAHRWNENRANKAMQEGITPIVIDNVNNTSYAARAYVRAAQKYGYEVEFAESDTPWRFNVEELAKRNKHNVPQERIQEMLDDWEPELTVDGVLNSVAPWDPKPTKQD